MSTTLPIGEYVIDISDGRNWTLQKPVVRKNRTTGEEYEGEDVLGYYGTLQSASRALFREHLANAGPTTIPKLTRYIEEAENRIIAAVTALHDQGEMPDAFKATVRSLDSLGDQRAAGDLPVPVRKPQGRRQVQSSTRAHPVVRVSNPRGGRR